MGSSDTHTHTHTCTSHRQTHASTCRHPGTPHMHAHTRVHMCKNRKTKVTIVNNLEEHPCFGAWSPHRGVGGESAQGGPLGAILGALGGPPGALGRHFWGSWGPCRGLLGAILGALGLLGAPGWHHGASGGPFSRFQAPLGGSLVGSWRPTWPSWGRLGAILGPSWGHRGAILWPCVAVVPQLQQ